MAASSKTRAVAPSMILGSRSTAFLGVGRGGQRVGLCARRVLVRLPDVVWNRDAQAVGPSVCTNRSPGAGRYRSFGPLPRGPCQRLDQGDGAVDPTTM